ncbi:hypothetical protein ACKS0A_01316 [Histoplasma ohiense]
MSVDDADFDRNKRYGKGFEHVPEPVFFSNVSRPRKFIAIVLIAKFPRNIVYVLFLKIMVLANFTDGS